MKFSPSSPVLILIALTMFCFGTGWAVTSEGEGTAADTNASLRLDNADVHETSPAVTDDEDRATLEVATQPVLLLAAADGAQGSGPPARNQAPSGSSADDAEASADDKPAEQLLVVGSRFAPRTVITSPVPIDNVTADDLRATGQLTFDKMLTYSVPAFNSSQQTISDATAHFDPADLRGLGPSRTLVLVNGKRKNASSLVFINDTPGKGEVGVDLKSIPTAAIERIEVLRDGASAQYGSDAIAGVINIILKEDYEHTDVSLFGGVTTEGDGESRGYSVNTGFKLGPNGFINVAHTYSDQKETNRAGEPGQDDLFGVGADDPWILRHPDLGMRVGLPNMTTSDVFYNAKYRLEEGGELYSFGGLVIRDGLSYALYRAPYWVPDENFIFHNEGEVDDGFHPTFEADIVDKSLVFGFQKDTETWNYDLSHTYGSNEVEYSVNNSLNVDLGAETPTSFRNGGYEFRNNITNLDLSRQIETVQIALGTEVRTENFVANAGEEASWTGSGTQSFPGLQPQNEADANRNSVGLYGELSVDLTPDLLIGGAARFEDFSDFGDAFTWKLNGRYKFMEDRVSVRGAVSTGFRAPSLHQIHLSIVQTLISGGTVSNQGTFDNNSPILRDLEVLPLKEEEALNFTAGVAIRPVDGLHLSLDFYQVDVDDRIVYSSSIASSDTNTVVGRILADNNITSLKFFTNAVDTRTKGVDVVASYNTNAGNGVVDVSLGANINTTDIRGNIATPAPIGDAGVSIFDRKEQSRIVSARPETKILIGLGYGQGPYHITLNNTVFGEVTWRHATDPSLDQTFASKLVTDVYFNYQHSSSLGFAVGIQNLLDVFPDEIEPGDDVVTDLGGRFRYPWEVNQFGFQGTTATASINMSF